MYYKVSIWIKIEKQQNVEAAEELLHTQKLWSRQEEPGAKHSAGGHVAHRGFFLL